MTAQPALYIDKLEKTYANGFHALKGISFSVNQGDFFALLGPNGAGKSTAIRIVSSLTVKTAGTVRIFDIDIDRDFGRAKRMLGVVPQEFNFSQFETPYNIVVNQAGFYGIPRPEARERAAHYLDQLSLWDKRNQQARALSGGMKRRLMIARALVHQPKLLILDEPTAGVDIEIRRSMWEFLKEINDAGTTIILTTHYLEEAESLCRNIAIIDDGRLIQNTSTRKLLDQLGRQTYILELESGIDALPELPEFELHRVDDLTLEAVVERSRSINDLFRALSGRGIEVSSLRNKSNRLEELFLGLVRGGRAENAA